MPLKSSSLQIVRHSCLATSANLLAIALTETRLDDRFFHAARRLVYHIGVAFFGRQRAVFSASGKAGQDQKTVRRMLKIVL